MLGQILFWYYYKYVLCLEKFTPDIDIYNTCNSIWQLKPWVNNILKILAHVPNVLSVNKGTVYQRSNQSSVKWKEGYIFCDSD